VIISTKNYHSIFFIRLGSTSK